MNWIKAIIHSFPSIAFYINICRMYSKINSRILNTGTNIDQLYNEINPIGLYLDNLLNISGDPIFWRNKFEYLLLLQKKINYFKNQYDTLVRLAQINGIKIENYDEFCRNQKESTSFHSMFREHGCDTRTLVKLAEDLIEFVRNENAKK